MDLPSRNVELSDVESDTDTGLEMEMEIAHVDRRDQSVVVVTVRERMDIFSAPLLMRLFKRLVQDGARHFVVDLSPVGILESDGDYPLLYLLKEVQTATPGGSVALVCPPCNPVRILYELTHLDTLFEIESSLEEALDRVG